MRSAFKRFRVELAVFDGMPFKEIHHRLDAHEEEMLAQFDQWRAQERPVILAIESGRYVSNNADNSPFFVWMKVLYEAPT